MERIKKKVLTIYYIDLENQLEKSSLDYIRGVLDVDLVICSIAENKLEHLQYPYMVLDEF